MWCILYGVKNGVKGMKWEIKQFIFLVIVFDVDELVFGRYKLEFIRLLLEMIEDDDDKQDFWMMSFKFLGKV